MKYILIAALVVLVSCKTSETSQTSNFVVNETWLTVPSFEIDCTTAYPFVTNALSQVAGNLNFIGAGDTVNRINLQGRGDFLRINDNNVLADISYYGIQQFGNANANSRNNGIVLNDPIEDYKITHNQKKNRKQISFKASNDFEHYEFNITVYPSGKCTIEVNSSKRNFIKYDGLLKEFVKE